MDAPKLQNFNSKRGQQLPPSLYPDRSLWGTLPLQRLGRGFQNLIRCSRLLFSNGTFLDAISFEGGSNRGWSLSIYCGQIPKFEVLLRQVGKSCSLDLSDVREPAHLRAQVCNKRIMRTSVFAAALCCSLLIHSTAAFLPTPPALAGRSAILQKCSTPASRATGPGIALKMRAKNDDSEALQFQGRRGMIKRCSLT